MPRFRPDSQPNQTSRRLPSMPGKYNGSTFGSGILFAVITILVSLATLSVPAQCQHYKVIYNFTGQGSDGESPYSGPMLDASGNLYGTTYAGGTFGSGSVYRLSPHGSSWSYTSLYSFRAGMDGVRAWVWNSGVRSRSHFVWND